MWSDDGPVLKVGVLPLVRSHANDPPRPSFGVHAHQPESKSQSVSSMRDGAGVGSAVGKAVGICDGSGVGNDVSVGRSDTVGYGVGEKVPAVVAPATDTSSNDETPSSAAAIAR